MQSLIWFICHIIVPDMHKTPSPILHNRACSMVILALQPLQVLGISSREWLYCSLTLSLHSSTNRPVPFNQLGKTEKPCARGSVTFNTSCHRGFVPAAAVKEDLLILELIPLSCQASLGGAYKMCPKVKPGCSLHNG
jgi:hypothetical protein